HSNGRRCSGPGDAGLADASEAARQPCSCGLSTPLDVGAELCELRLEILVAAVDEAHTVHAGRPLSGERSDQVAEAGAQVGNDEFGGVQLARSGDHRRMAEVAATEAARRPAEALPVRLNGRAH